MRRLRVYIRCSDAQLYMQDLRVVQNEYTMLMCSVGDTFKEYNLVRHIRLHAWRWGISDALPHLTTVYSQERIDSAMRILKESFNKVTRRIHNVLGSRYIAYSSSRAFQINARYMSIRMSITTHAPGGHVVFSTNPSNRIYFSQNNFRDLAFANCRVRAWRIGNIRNMTMSRRIRECRLEHELFSQNIRDRMGFSYHICTNELFVHKRFDDSFHSYPWRPDYGACKCDRWRDLYMIRRKIIRRIKKYYMQHADTLKSLEHMTMIVVKNFFE